MARLFVRTAFVEDEAISNPFDDLVLILTDASIKIESTKKKHFII